jgi:hypothetical protein
MGQLSLGILSDTRDGWAFDKAVHEVWDTIRDVATTLHTMRTKARVSPYSIEDPEFWKQSLKYRKIFESQMLLLGDACDELETLAAQIIKSMWKYNLPHSLTTAQKETYIEGALDKYYAREADIILAIEDEDDEEVWFDKSVDMHELKNYGYGGEE